MFDNSTLCKLYPSKCELGSSNMDWCAFNAYECLLDQTWDFCVSFPELCATKPTYHYAKIDDLGKAICDSDHAMFCEPGSIDDVKSATIVCNNLSLLSSEVLGQSSVGQFCQSKAYEACLDPAIKAKKVCEGLELADSLCGLNEDKCKFGTSTWDKCAADWVSCLLNPQFDICTTAPELCSATPAVWPTDRSVY
jgi:hypothetical protein